MRKTIVQILTVLLAVGFLSQFAFAGGIDNKQNFSANYIGSASRNAAIDGADIAAYNPAGIMQMENGLYAELDTQVFFVDYDHNFDGESYGVSEMPIVPSLFTIYKQDKWAAFGTVTINGGGGKVEYDDGNIVTETIGNAVASGAFGAGAGSTFTDQFAGVESIYYTLTAGGSYAVNDMFSVSAAARYITAIKEVDIHGTNSYFGYILGKYEEDADGFGGVFGINIRPNNNINIALKYETKVELDWDCDIDPAASAFSVIILGQNGKVDGQSYPRDLPAVFSAGLVWDVTPQLSISPSYTLYFEKDADWDTTQNTLTTKNSYDLALSVGYSFNDKLSATVGYMYTDIGLEPKDYSLTEQMSPPLDCHTVALGTTYKFNEKITVSTGLMGAFYVSDSAVASGAAPAVEYEKTVYIVAFNLQYKFF
ncbi:OmpP1/FadL family transporter [Desulfobacula sp.]|uniref:OmpP1/FadL family transporter n=1 Tax=Desulfobacula sp. TaxID=2593537 RepID=UPI0026288DBD|nr:outer membrane protein transport protein [Desulfobacula sp.]